MREQWRFSNQHLVSQVLLRQFGSRPRGLVGAVDLSSLISRTDSPKNLGFMVDLVTTGAAQTERVWQKVETALPHALKLVRRREILKHPKFMDFIKDCIVLHFARSFALALLFAREQPRYKQQVINNVLARYSSAAVVEAFTGVVVSDFTAQRLAPEYLGTAFDNDLEKEGFMGKLLVENFERGRGLGSTAQLAERLRPRLGWARIV